MTDRTARLNRRDFVRGAAAAAVWPVVVRAQAPERLRRVGILYNLDEHDTQTQGRMKAFVDSLQRLGWTEGHNIRFDARFTGGDAARIAPMAQELIELHPDAIFSNSTPVTTELSHQTRVIPIVFVGVTDPISSGFVDSLARPGGNVTGFVSLEPSIGGKWLELIKEIAPGVDRVALMFNPDTAPYARLYQGPFEAAAAEHGVSALTAPVHSLDDIKTAIMGLARAPGGGLVVMIDSFMIVHRQAVAALASDHRLPTIYGVGTRGGLVSYAIDFDDLSRRAAAYVDRILKGAAPAGLPVQLPTRFRLVVDLKVAKAIGLTVPQSLLLRADEVIE